MQHFGVEEEVAAPMGQAAEGPVGTRRAPNHRHSAKGLERIAERAATGIPERGDSCQRRSYPFDHPVKTVSDEDQKRWKRGNYEANIEELPERHEPENEEGQGNPGEQNR